MASVLLVVTAARHWTLNDGTRHPTGFWAEELLVPHQILTGAGWEVTIATPGGTPPVVDRLSLRLGGGVLPHKRRRFEAALGELAPVLERPASLSGVDVDAFDLIFYPGGHGPMEDLASDETSGRLLAARLGSGRPLALLCHAPAAILAAVAPDGTSPFAGYRMTGLSNREELVNRFARKAPWLLEDKLRESGVDYRRGRIPFRPFLVVDRNVYSGQNPQSSEKLAERIVGDLSG